MWRAQKYPCNSVSRKCDLEKGSKYFSICLATMKQAVFSDNGRVTLGDLLRAKVLSGGLSVSVCGLGWPQGVGSEIWWRDKKPRVKAAATSICHNIIWPVVFLLHWKPVKALHRLRFSLSLPLRDSPHALLFSHYISIRQYEVYIKIYAYISIWKGCGCVFRCEFTLKSPLIS